MVILLFFQVIVESSPTRLAKKSDSPPLGLPINFTYTGKRLGLRCVRVVEVRVG